METGRQKSAFNLEIDIDKRVKEIMELFGDFTSGIRMLLLLQRTKDGGNANDEEKRVFDSYITFSTEEFKSKLKNLLILKHFQKVPTRIYVSANPRNLKKVIKYIELALVEAHYADDVCAKSVRTKLIRNPRHFLMQQANKDSSLFLLDLDDEDDKDIMGIALQRIAELDIEEVMRYRTKNGWHIVVKPFNLELWQSVGEVKKDPLLLLDY